jgi:hypothetical protein
MNEDVYRSSSIWIHNVHSIVTFFSFCNLHLFLCLLILIYYVLVHLYKLQNAVDFTRICGRLRLPMDDNFEK